MRIKRVYSGVGMSENFMDVLPKRLHLVRGYVAQMDTRTVKTMFREVRIVPHDKAYIRPNVKAENTDALIPWLVKRLRTVLEENLSPSRLNVFLHSSGIDSRILSGIVSAMDVDNVLFVCTKWEAAAFLKIMEHLGESRYEVIDGPADRYYEEHLQFDKVWKHVNGACGIPTNLFWYPFVQLGLKPEDVKCFGGYWGNELMLPRQPKEKDVFKGRFFRFYYHTMAQRPFFSNAVMPLTDDLLLATIYKNRKEYGDFRREVMIAIGPGLGKIARIDHHGDRGHSIAAFAGKLHSQYQKSWYGKRFPMEKMSNPTTEFATYWSRYTSASICQHLLKEGYTIG